MKQVRMALTEQWRKISSTPRPDQRDETSLAGVLQRNLFCTVKAHDPYCASRDRRDCNDNEVPWCEPTLRCRKSTLAAVPCQIKENRCASVHTLAVVYERNLSKKHDEQREWEAKWTSPASDTSFESDLQPSPKCQRCRNRVNVIKDNHSFFCLIMIDAAR